MNGIGRVNHLPVLRTVTPGERSGQTGHRERNSGRDRLAEAAARIGERRTRNPFGAGTYSPFAAQMISGLMDAESDGVTMGQGAIAYIVARDRIADLPVGFLVARAV